MGGCARKRHTRRRGARSAGRATAADRQKNRRGLLPYQSRLWPSRAAARRPRPLSLTQSARAAALRAAGHVTCHLQERPTRKPRPGSIDAVCIDGEAGDAVFFNIHTVHGSTGNTSPEPRASFINRYITSDDYQTYFATDTVMRATNRAAYEEGVATGMLPPKERNYIVRGCRTWDDEGPAWVMNEGVNH